MPCCCICNAIVLCNLQCQCNDMRCGLLAASYLLAALWCRYRQGTPLSAGITYSYVNRVVEEVVGLKNINLVGWRANHTNTYLFLRTS
eukprot:scaffold10511_cov146-Skeletonema_dohrnii-CCMP3373.AAC.5